MNDKTRQRAELYVRSLAPCGVRSKQEEMLDRLLELERQGAFDEVDLTVWGNAICLDDTSARVGAGAHIAARIRDFHTWCEEKQASLEPFFTWSSVDSSVADDSFHRVIPPHRCLAIYRGDELAEVYPCKKDGTVQSLEEGIRSFERQHSRPVVIQKRID